MTVRRFEWSRRGYGYEVSTKGDKRFSALVARMPDGRTIECHYQCDVKGYCPGGTDWRLGKGKPPLDPTRDIQSEYFDLWAIWVQFNPSLFHELYLAAMTHRFLLTDCHAATPVNQAWALAELLNEHYP